MKEKLRTILAEATELEPEEITDESSPEDTPEWDSFAHMNMVAEVEKAYSIKLTMEEVIEMQSLSKMVEVISRKL
tara:strand:- start:11900 stop:12124 length:225 start_codon:yes stop_codon:yes gene_type:complete